MTFELNQAQKNEINLFVAAEDYVGGYGKVLEFISDVDPQTEELSPKDGVSTSVWLWFRGAEQVIQGVGNFSDLIRGYTSRQHELRYGLPLTLEEGQALSNKIAEYVLTDVGDAGSFPTIDEIAEKDALAAVEKFGGNRAAWSGNPIFLSFGHDQSFKTNLLHEGGDQGDTYDLLAAYRSGLDNIGAVAGSIDTVLETIDQALKTASGADVDYYNGLSVAATAGIQAKSFLEAAYGDMWSFVQVPEFNVRDVRVGTIFDDEDLQGTSGIDVIHGGTGNDTLVGSGNDDILDGGKGYDTADYSQLDREIVVRVDQLEAKADFIAYVLKGADWDGLYGIERIEGTPFQDTLIVAGPIPDGLDLTIDGNGGQGPHPENTDVIDAGDAATALKIAIAPDGSGSIKALDGSGGTIKLEGFDTVIHGSAFGDRIEDLSGHATRIYGGGGDDVIHVAGVGSEMYGGAGADTGESGE